MRIRSVLLSTLSVLCGLFVGAVLLSSCDSGAGLSSLEDMPLNDGLAGKARAWHTEQVQIEVSDDLTKVTSDQDSLVLLAFIEKFPPDWDEAVVLSLDGTEEALVLTTTLGEYTDERYDTTMYHVRTLLVRMEPSGDIISGNIVAFSSEEKLSKDDFVNYTEQYIAKDFGGMKMTVSRYTVIFEDIDSYLYRPGQIPLEMLMSSVEKQIIGNGLSKSLTPCRQICTQYKDTYGCVGPLTSGPSNYGVPECSLTQIPPGIETFCTNFCWPGSGNGSGGGGGGSGSGGGGGNGNGEGEDDCSCNSTVCKIIKEYETHGVNWTPSCLNPFGK